MQMFEYKVPQIISNKLTSTNKVPQNISNKLISTMLLKLLG